LILTYKYRLYPTNYQIDAIDKMINQHRYLYNETLAQRKDTYEQEQKSVSYVDQSKWLTQHRKENETYSNLNFSSCQRTLKRLDKAFQSFFRRVKSGETPGYPRFKGYNRFDSVEFAYSDGIKLRGNHLMSNISEKSKSNFIEALKAISKRPLLNVKQDGTMFASQLKSNVHHLSLQALLSA